MKPRFILDSMLGKLARWLRILGYDAEYHRDFDDDQLLKVAETENRILLTRDRALHRRAIMNDLRSHFLTDVKLSSWLTSLKRSYGIRLELDTHTPRCSLCNQLLSLLKSPSKLDSLPYKIRKSYTEFWSCPECSKIYWQGSHWKNMIEFAETVSRDD